MTTPIDACFDQVEWEALPPEVADEREREYQANGTLYATHEGVLNLGGISLNVARLNNGQRVIAMESLEKLFGAMGDNPQ